MDDNLDLGLPRQTTFAVVNDQPVIAMTEVVKHNDALLVWIHIIAFISLLYGDSLFA